MNDRIKTNARIIWAFNIIALIVLIILASSCNQAECPSTTYAVTYKTVDGEIQDRYFYLPEDLYNIRPDIRDGGYVMKVESACGEYEVGIGVIEVLKWQKLHDRYDVDTIFSQGDINTPVDSSTFIIITDE